MLLGLRGPTPSPPHHLRGAVPDTPFIVPLLPSHYSVKSSHELLRDIHKAKRSKKKKRGLPTGGRVVRVSAVLQQLEGCVG